MHQLTLTDGGDKGVEFVEVQELLKNIMRFKCGKKGHKLYHCKEVSTKDKQAIYKKKAETSGSPQTGVVYVEASKEKDAETGDRIEYPSYNQLNKIYNTLSRFASVKVEEDSGYKRAPEGDAVGESEDAGDWKVKGRSGSKPKNKAATVTAVKFTRAQTAIVKKVGPKKGPVQAAGWAKKVVSKMNMSTLGWWTCYLDSCATHHTFFTKHFLHNIMEGKSVMNVQCNAEVTNTKQ